MKKIIATASAVALGLTLIATAMPVFAAKTTVGVCPTSPIGGTFPTPAGTISVSDNVLSTPALGTDPTTTTPTQGPFWQ